MEQFHPQNVVWMSGVCGDDVCKTSEIESTEMDASLTISQSSEVNFWENDDYGEQKRD